MNRKSTDRNAKLLIRLSEQHFYKQPFYDTRSVSMTSISVFTASCAMQNNVASSIHLLFARPIAQGPCDRRRESCWAEKTVWTKTDCNSHPPHQNRQGPWKAVLHCNFATLTRLCAQPPLTHGIDKDHGQQFYTVLIATSRSCWYIGQTSPYIQLLSIA